MRAARRTAPLAAAREIDEQTGVGELLMRSLLRAQLRLAVATLGVYAVLLGGLPLLFALAPRMRSVQLLGLPLPWLLLGVLVYPGLAFGAWIFVRAAERNERDFVELVERS
jgi:O-antigen/teichoic acid export membrane protein